jgi:putative transposase
MPSQKIEIGPSEYYHIYNRGNNRRVIFHDDEDYNTFMCMLFYCNNHKNSKLRDFNSKDNDPLVYIGAYCLMPNHFHILIKSINEKDVSKFMQKLTTAYVMYYNNKYLKTGGLFEGRYKIQHADTDNYLKYLFSYIHLNPIKLIDSKWKDDGIKDLNKAKKFLFEYKYSSFLDYINKESRFFKKTLSYKDFPKYFLTKGDIIKELMIWLNYGKE